MHCSRQRQAAFDFGKAPQNISGAELAEAQHIKLLAHIIKPLDHQRTVIGNEVKRSEPERKCKVTIPEIWMCSRQVIIQKKE